MRSCAKVIADNIPPAKSDPITTKELCEITGVANNTVAKYVNYWVQAGYISKWILDNGLPGRKPYGFTVRRRIPKKAMKSWSELE